MCAHAAAVSRTATLPKQPDLNSRPYLDHVVSTIHQQLNDLHDPVPGVQILTGQAGGSQRPAPVFLASKPNPTHQGEDVGNISGLSGFDDDSLLSSEGGGGDFDDDDDVDADNGDEGLTSEDDL